MIKKIFMLMSLLFVFSSKSYAVFEYPRFKSLTDRENENLIGNVRKVVLISDDGIKCEYNFNQQGNYTSVAVLEGRPSSNYPFCKMFYRYYCEGLLVNNYFREFFRGGYRHEDFHIPFWLEGMGGARNLSFNYDAKGNLVAVTDKTSGGLNRYDYIYDEKGHLVTRKCNDLPMMKLQWTGPNMTSYYLYDRNGSLHDGYDIEVRNLNYFISDKKDNNTRITIEMDSNGKIVEYRKVTEVGYSKPQGIRVICSYNDLGLLDKITNSFFAGDRKITTITNIKYDSYKNIAEYITTENSIIKKNIRYVYNYDKNGNWISKLTYSIKQGNIEVKQKIGTETREITYFNDLDK